MSCGSDCYPSCCPGTSETCYSGPSGTEDVGVCRAGTRQCQIDGTWGACTGEVTPSDEACDGLDNDCDRVVDNGFDLQNDAANCGSCGAVCNVPNATAGCAGGHCTITVCDAGYANCTPSVMDGCETQLGTVTNCGACGDVCSAPNTTAICDHSTNPGTCSYTCVTGFADCNGTMSDGCEIDTMTDDKNCGRCGHACMTGVTCQQGTCQTPTPTCDCSNLGFCNGHGTCTAQCICQCDEPYTGVACTDLPPTACSGFATCSECQNNAAAGCVFCGLTFDGATNVCTTAAACLSPQVAC